MSTSYSTSLKLALMGIGDQSGTWGQTNNTNLGTLIEQAVTGSGAINVSALGGSSYTLTNYNGTLDDARNAVLIFTGSPSATVTIYAPLVNKLYTVVNLTGQTITMSATGGSISLNIPAGMSSLCFCDAYNVSGLGAGFYTQINGVSGPFTISNNLSVSGNSAITGNETIGGTLGVTGVASLAGGGTTVTRTANDNTTNIATTAFVETAVTNATGALGTMSTQNANSVAITGGSMSGVSVSGGNVITSSNIGSQSVNYASSAGTAGNGGVTSVNGNTGAVSLLPLVYTNNFSLAFGTWTDTGFNSENVIGDFAAFLVKISWQSSSPSLTYFTGLTTFGVVNSNSAAGAAGQTIIPGTGTWGEKCYLVSSSNPGTFNTPYNNLAVYWYNSGGYSYGGPTSATIKVWSVG